MTTAVVRLPEDLRQQILDHCLAALPEEGCGLAAIVGDLVVKVYPTGNEDGSSRSYTIPPAEHYAALVDAEARGWDLGGVFHSHPRGPAAPSMVDVERALVPDWVHFVIALNGDPEVRAFQIRDGQVSEIGIV